MHEDRYNRNVRTAFCAGELLGDRDLRFAIPRGVLVTRLMA